MGRVEERLLRVFQVEVRITVVVDGRQLGVRRKHAAFLHDIDRAIKVFALEPVPIVVILAVLDMKLLLESTLQELDEKLFVAARRDGLPPLPVMLNGLVVFLEVFLAVGRRLVNKGKWVPGLRAALGLIEKVFVLRMELVVISRVQDVVVVLPRWAIQHGVLALDAQSRRDQRLQCGALHQRRTKVVHQRSL